MAASHQGETAIARRAIISTTSRAYPSDPAAPRSIGRYGPVTGQSDQAAEHHTNPTSTSRQLAPGVRRCRSRQIRAPLRPLFPLRSSSVSSWTPLSAGCLTATRKAACRTLAKRQGPHDYFRCRYRPTGRVR